MIDLYGSGFYLGFNGCKRKKDKYPCAKKALTHRGEITPVETVDAFFVTAEFLFREMGCGIPETNVSVKTCSNECGLHVDGEDIADRASMAILLGISLEEGVPSSNRPLFFESFRIVDMNDTIRTTCVKISRLALRLPFRVTKR